MTDELDKADAGTWVLNYRSAGDEGRQWPAWAQATIGFALAGGTSGTVILFGSIFIIVGNRLPMSTQVVLTVLIWLGPLVVFT